MKDFLHHFQNKFHKDYQESRGKISIFTTVKYMVKINVLFLSTYLALLGIYSNGFEQYQENIIHWPRLAGNSLCNKTFYTNYISYNALHSPRNNIQIVGNQELRFIIAIDVSISVNKKIEEKLLKSHVYRTQYQSNIEEVNKYINNSINKFQINDINKYDDVIKLKACFLLLKFYNDTIFTKYTNKKFAIVIFGEELEQIFPSEPTIDFADLNESNLKSALLKIKRVNNQDKNTDYFTLIDYVNNRFPNKNTFKPQIHTTSLVVYSDLIHDREIRLQKDSQLIRNKNNGTTFEDLAFNDSINLVEKLKDISSRNLFSNIIIIDHGSYQKQNKIGKFNIWPILNRYFDQKSLVLIPLEDHDTKVVKQDMPINSDLSFSFHFSNTNSTVFDSAGIIFDTDELLNVGFEKSNYFGLPTEKFEEHFSRKNILEDYPIESINYKVLTHFAA